MLCFDTHQDAEEKYKEAHAKVFGSARGSDMEHIWRATYSLSIVEEPISLESSGEEDERAMATVTTDRAFVHPQAEPFLNCLSVR